MDKLAQSAIQERLLDVFLFMGSGVDSLALAVLERRVDRHRYRALSALHSLE